MPATRTFIIERVKFIMKPSIKMAATLALALGLGAGAWVWAEEGKDSQSDGRDAVESCLEKPGPRGHVDHTQLIEQHLSSLHADLKLNTEQDTAWNEWAGQVRKHMAEIKEKRPDFRALENLPAPERMEKWLAFGKERQSKLEQGLAATKTFYAALQPEQRQIFDQRFDFFKPGGRKGKHHPMN